MISSRRTLKNQILKFTFAHFAFQKYDYRKLTKRKNKNLNRLITDNRFRKKSGVLCRRKQEKRTRIAIRV